MGQARHSAHLQVLDSRGEGGLPRVQQSSRRHPPRTRLRCFVGYGGVLSAIRDNDLMPHDDDLDVIVSAPRGRFAFIGDFAEAISELLTGRGLEVTGGGGTNGATLRSLDPPPERGEGRASAPAALRRPRAPAAALGRHLAIVHPLLVGGLAGQALLAGEGAALAPLGRRGGAGCAAAPEIADERKELRRAGPKPHAASWKITPSVKRSPERTRLTPWRRLTR